MTDRRALAIVLAVPAACWLACWPFVDMAVNDDFGYAFVAKRLLATGRFHYNGWSSPILGVQAAWGAGFAMAFGFSHDVLRLSVLPLAIACAGLCYRLHRRLDVPAAWSLLATLLLVTSPIFTPWSASFMTDVPGLLFTLAIFHGALSLASARTQRETLIAAFAIATLGILGGTVRQSNFVLAGALLVIEGWRRRRGGVADVVPALLLLAISTVALLTWYARQPYATLDPIPSLAQAPAAMLSLTGLLLSLGLFLLPAGVGLLRLDATTAATQLSVGIACVAACGGIVAFAPPTWPIAFFAAAPWAGSTFTPTGLLFAGIDAPGERPIVFQLPVLVALAAAVYWMATLAVLAIARRRAAIVRWLGSLARADGDAQTAGVGALIALAIVYVAMLAPRAADRLVFDRYLIVLLPIATAATMFAVRRRLSTASPGAAAWATIALYAFVGVAITFDHFAELRARVRVAGLFADLPRTALANGLTFDAWTQLEARGYVNDPRITTPADAYQLDPQRAVRGRYFWFLPHTPAVRPRWIVANVVAPPADAGDAIVFGYHAILPPWRRWLVAYPIRGLATAPTPASSPDNRPGSADESDAR